MAFPHPHVVPGRLGRAYRGHEFGAREFLTGSGVLHRIAAVLGGICVALHLGTAASADLHGPPVLAWLLLAMAMACLPCLHGLWHGATWRNWAMTGAMYVAMLVTHVVLVLGPWRPAAHSGHAHAGGATWLELAMWVGLALSAVQVMLSVAVLVRAAAVGRPHPA